ncbi:MAG TPA: hypothetical protein VF098_06395 [Sphingomicrobium sp.]|jgi:hypothetical protein
MAKKATGKSSSGKSTKKSGTAVARVSASGGERSSGSQGGFDASEAFIKLLQSPLAAELVAVAATAALAALAEHGFTTGGDGRGKRAGKAVKEAGKAAAAAVGRRLGYELDEIRKAATAKDGARA